MSAFAGVLKRYGQCVTLRGETVRAFIQPEVSRQEVVPGEQTAIGWTDARLWRYIGTAPVEPGDVLTWETLTFRVRSSRACSLGRRIHHWRASLELEREAAV